MQKRAAFSCIGLACALGVAPFASAEISTTITGTSDYIFDGISQTQGDPALQVSLDYSHESGAYAGIWTSNVEYAGPDEDQEVDYYVGYYRENGDFNYDISWLRYTYIGITDANNFDYNEVSLRLGYKNTAVQAWRSGDYAGSNSHSFIWRLSQDIPLDHGFTGHVAYTVTTTKNNNVLFSSNGVGEDRNESTIVGVSRDWQGFNFDVSYSNHSEDGAQDAQGQRVAKPVWYFTVSRSFTLMD